MKRTILETGASSGFGFLIAKKLHEAGNSGAKYEKDHTGGN